MSNLFGILPITEPQLKRFVRDNFEPRIDDFPEGFDKSCDRWQLINLRRMRDFKIAFDLIAEPVQIAMDFKQAELDEKNREIQTLKNQLNMKRDQLSLALDSLTLINGETSFMDRLPTRKVDARRVRTCISNQIKKNFGGSSS